MARAHRIANKTTPEAIANWEAALDEGYAYQHVAEMYGVAKETVRKYLPGRGWTPEQVRGHGTLMKHHNEKMSELERKGKIILPHDPTRDAALDMMQRRFAGRSEHRHQDE